MRKKCSFAYLSMYMGKLWFTEVEIKPFCFFFKVLPLMKTKGASLSSFVYLYFLDPSNRVAQIVPPALLEPNHTTFKAQELEHSHAQE